MRLVRLAPAVLVFWAFAASATQPIRIATFNVQNYLDAPSGTRPAKSAASKAKVRESIRALDPHVLAIEEMGSRAALEELRSSLRTERLDFPYAELVQGWDTNIHVAVLSRFPFAATRPHTNDAYVLFGKRFRVKRGFAEVDVRVNEHFSFTLLAAHLKSKLSAFEADEQELREQEAVLLRDHVDELLDGQPNANVVVVGDFNDTQDSKTVRTIIGRKHALFDTRPFEINGDDQPNNNPHYAAPRITWTHCYGKEDSFRRIDYILLSRNLKRYWQPAESRVLKLPNWGVASDHRPIVVTLAVP